MAIPIKEYQKHYHATHRKECNLYSRKTKKKVLTWFINYKKTIVCSKCGESDYRCLQFHHRDPSKKTRDVSTLARHGYSQKRIMDEIAKCDVLCVNCHRLSHNSKDEGDDHGVPKRSVWVKNYKKSLKCEECGFSHYSCIHFHHKDPSKKIDSIGRMCGNKGYSLEDIILEIAKCSVLCANCHFKIHATKVDENGEICS